MKTNLEKRLAILENQNCTDELPEDMKLCLHWHDQELMPEQQESNRRFYKWLADHPGAFSQL